MPGVERFKRRWSAKGAHASVTLPDAGSARSDPAEATVTAAAGLGGAGVDVAVDLGLMLAGGGAQIVGALQVHPELRIDAEIAAEAQGGIGGEGALAGDDLGDTVRRHAQGHRELVRVDLEGFEELLEEDFAGMNRGQRLRHVDTKNVVN